MSDLFLLDSDIFISSYRTHHPFSYKEFHSFWRWLEKLASERKVLLLDSVYKEITHKNSKGQIDELGQWAEAIFSERQISHKTDDWGRGLRTFSWRPNGKIFVCSVLRNESVRWGCISPRR